MKSENISVFGIYPTVEIAEAGVDSLRSNGFRAEDISALLPDNKGTKDFVHSRATKAPEGALTGASTGVVLGGALGWLAGIGSLAVPGVGPLIAAGPIVAMLTGVGAVGLAGGIIGGLMGFGVPEYEAKRYEGRVRTGKVLLSVHCDNPEWVGRARSVLEATGAEEISAANEARADYAASVKPMQRSLTV